MLELNQKISTHHHAEHARDERKVDGVLRLPFEVRQKSRFRAQLMDGADVGVVLDRGSVLRGGDVLTGPAGQCVVIEAAAETVSTVTHKSPTQVARAAYHLGNRHVPLQVGDGWVRYLHDHVLDEMCAQLGLSVLHEDAPFEPESGAYGGGHKHHD